MPAQNISVALIANEVATERDATCDAAELARLRRKLAAKQQELEAFAQTAAHDLKAPLRAIAGFSNLLRADYAGQLDTQAETWLDHIVGSAERMRDLIDGLYEYSVLNCDSHRAHDVDCGQACDEAISNLGPWIEESGAVVAHSELPILPGDSALRPRIRPAKRSVLARA